MEIIGFLAAFCTTISFVPQVIRTIRTKDTKGISLLMYSIFVVGVGLWLVYGIMIDDLPMTIANVITLGLAIIILTLKVRDVLSDKKSI